MCEFGHTTVPYGIGARGHAVGTNQRGKGPSIATVMSTPHAQGQKSKNQTAGEPQGRKLQKKEFRTDREGEIKAVAPVAGLPVPEWGNKRSATNVTRGLH